MDSFNIQTSMGLRGIGLENESLKVTILPEYGANVWSIFDKKRGREVLWHHPTLKPGRFAEHDRYDNTFAGGWHDIFPSDIEEHWKGKLTSDHGELWYRTWDCERIDNSSRYGWQLTVSGLPSGARVSKWISIDPVEPCLTVDYEIQNEGEATLDFMFKLHAAIQVVEGDRILLPTSRVYSEVAELPSRVTEGHWYDWPYTEEKDIDLSLVTGQEAGVSELLIGAASNHGICGISKTREGIDYVWEYDPLDLPYPWLFTSYGGWQDTYLAIVEPANGYPLGFYAAKETGVLRSLERGQRFKTRVQFKILEDAK
jgi:hypothetical protein